MNTTDSLMLRLTILRRLSADLPFRRTPRRRFAICLLSAAGLAAALPAAPPALAQDTTGPTRIDRDGSGDGSRDGGRDLPVKRTTVKVEELGAPGAGSSGV